MKLDRNLISLDLEATGTDLEKDRIVQIGIVVLQPDGTRTSKSRLVNPGIPIPPDVAAIHGIDDEKVKDAPTFEKLAKALYSILSDCDITGYNVDHFDIPMLSRAFQRSGIAWPPDDMRVVDVFSILGVQERRTLAWTLKYYTGIELVDAHDARADADAAMTALLAQSEKYKAADVHALTELARDPAWVDRDGKFTTLINGSIVITFGKHSGTLLTRLDYSYLQWILKQTFHDSTKLVVQNELERRHREQELERQRRADSAKAP